MVRTAPPSEKLIPKLCSTESPWTGATGLVHYPRAGQTEEPGSSKRFIFQKPRKGRYTKLDAGGSIRRHQSVNRQA